MRDRFVGAERLLIARADGANELLAPAHAPESLADLGVLARFVFDAATQLGVPAVDVAWLLERLFTLLSSCDERRVEQWDLQSWWSYVQAERRSEAFRRYLADGLTRTLVAARGEGDERAHGRADPRPAAARPRARGRPCRPRARRARPRTPGSGRGSRI